LPFNIDGWVLLPDHLHAIWALSEGDAISEQRSDVRQDWL